MTVTFITRAGCHLCEVAHDVVLAARADHPFELLELDVDSDPELRSEWGEQVPVVLLDGELHSYFEVDRQTLLTALRESAAAR